MTTINATVMVPTGELPFALLARGVVLNVLREELPEDGESRFSAFAFGSGAYAALLLTTG